MVCSNIFLKENKRKQPRSFESLFEKLVTGCVRPGEFLAIMGASGAGKTTLLNCLTFRNTGKLKVSGERNLNGAKVNTDTLARISGYVQQDDLFIPTLTVKEHLEFQVNTETSEEGKKKTGQFVFHISGLIANGETFELQWTNDSCEWSD